MKPPPAPDAPVTAPSSEEPRLALGLRRRDQLFVGACVICALVLLLIQAARLGGWGQPVIEIQRLPERQYDYRLDVNRATWIEWALLEGIGEKLGRRIVEDREKNGPFASVDDVLRVKGIGPKIFERIRPWLTTNEQTSK